MLAQVFDPESAPRSTEVLVDPASPADKHIRDAQLLKALKAREKDAVILIEQYEVSRVKDSPGKDEAYREALAILDQLIDEHPSYASARNNRAQLRRWQFGDRNLLCQHLAGGSPATSAAARATVEDLRAAITLASPDRSTDAVSPAQGRLLGQAHTQLAALYHAAAKDLDGAEGCKIACAYLEGWRKEAFEDEASRLFHLGGLYGNEVAKALAVHTNPHAKLCGSIVKEAMRKEFSQA